MVSPYALLVVALGLLWIAGNPLPTHSRALAGDGVAGLLFAVLALAAVGVSRLQRSSAPLRGEGPTAFVGLGAREPLLVLGLAGLGALAAGGLDAATWWIGALVWVGLSLWYPRAGDMGRSFLVPACGMLVGLLLIAAKNPNWTPRIAVGLVLAAVLVTVHILVVRRAGFLRAERFWRATLAIGTLFALPTLLPIVGETVFQLDSFFYIVLPVTWLVLWGLGEGVRLLFPNRLDAASGSLRLGRGVWFSTRAWVWFLGLQLGGLAARQLDADGLGAPGVALLLLVFFAVALALGTAARRTQSERPGEDASRQLPLGLAVAPMLAPLLVIACLRITPLPAAWGEFSHLRGTIALLAPALALPLGGAVLLVAACIDRTRGRGFHVFGGADGAALLIAGAFAVGPFVSRWHPEFVAADLPVDGLAPWAAVLMGLAAAAVDWRLRLAERGQPLRTWSLLLLPVVGLGAGIFLVPSIGLIGAFLAASSGLVATMVADRLPRLRRTYAVQAA